MIVISASLYSCFHRLGSLGYSTENRYFLTAWQATTLVLPYHRTMRLKHRTLLTVFGLAIILLTGWMVAAPQTTQTTTADPLQPVPNTPPGNATTGAAQQTSQHTTASDDLITLCTSPRETTTVCKGTGTTVTANTQPHGDQQSTNGIAHPKTPPGNPYAGR